MTVENYEYYLGNTYYEGRPLKVNGKSRTTTSQICNIENSNGGTSWKVDLYPSLLENRTYNREIGLEWLQQAEAEHASVASFARHTLQLISIEAPSDLLLASQAASMDEIRHAKMCYGLTAAFTDREICPEIINIEGSLDDTDVKGIIQSIIQEGCIEETLSAIKGFF